MVVKSSSECANPRPKATSASLGPITCGTPKVSRLMRTSYCRALAASVAQSGGAGWSMRSTTIRIRTATIRSPARDRPVILRVRMSFCQPLRGFINGGTNYKAEWVYLAKTEDARQKTRTFLWAPRASVAFPYPREEVSSQVQVIRRSIQNFLHKLCNDRPANVTIQAEIRDKRQTSRFFLTREATRGKDDNSNHAPRWKIPAHAIDPAHLEVSARSWPENVAVDRLAWRHGACSAGDQRYFTECRQQGSPVLEHGQACERHACLRACWNDLPRPEIPENGLRDR